MNEAERAFDERDVLTEGYQRLIRHCYYAPQLVVTAWTNFMRTAYYLGFDKEFSRSGQLEIEGCGYYWTGD